jgi:hypothetical protein
MLGAWAVMWDLVPAVTSALLGDNPSLAGSEKLPHTRKREGRREVP